MADNLAHTYDRRQVVTFDILPDDVLLTIFDFYAVRYQDIGHQGKLFSNQDDIRKMQSWQSLVHVCRRWRGLVFGSPHRLNLKLFCKPGISTTKTHEVWPALPLLIQGDVLEKSVDNVIAELEHSDRILQISLNCHPLSKIESLWTAMQVPFPELAVLYLSCESFSYVPVLRDSFLGGSASRLRSFCMNGIPFLGLSKLLLSAVHLVHLTLRHIPHSGYISPEAMATCLSMLTSLEILRIEFESPQSSPDQESLHSPPTTRSPLPSLSLFSFKGVYEYLEELVAHIDTPRLIQMSATFFNDIDFDTSELIRLISHSDICVNTLSLLNALMLKAYTYRALNEARVIFDSRTASVRLQQENALKYFYVTILCGQPDGQLSSLAQICTMSSPLLSTTENLFIYESEHSQLDWKDGIENIGWLELLLPFVAVKNLYLSKQFAPRIVPALLEMTEDGTTEVLITLQKLYVEGFKPWESIEEDIWSFISARQLANHPVNVSVWDRSDEDDD